MTFKTAEGVIVITPEAPMKCELCGKVEETRPYGPQGERVCVDCGMKDGEEALQERIYSAWGK